MRPLRTLLAASAAILMISAPAQAGYELVPHQALYDLERLKRDRPSSFSRVGGRMVYNVDRTCDGLTYNHRLLMDLVSAQGAKLRSETILSFFEKTDGSMLQFSIKEKLNDRVLVELVGRAVRDDTSKTAKVTYSKREGKEEDALIALPARVMFPLQHTEELINAAIGGAITHNARTFDGDEISLADSFIRPAKQLGEDKGVIPEDMQGMKSWLTRVSFYKSEGGDSLPYYETQMRFWENGLSGSFTMESDDLAIRARLKKVELFEKPDCS